MKESAYYASKPPACSSPIVQKINGQLYRVHDGHRLGQMIAVNPSKYPINSVLFDKNDFEPEAQE